MRWFGHVRKIESEYIGRMKTKRRSMDVVSEGYHYIWCERRRRRGQGEMEEDDSLW